MEQYKPHLIISLGAAFNHDATKQNLGDALVSKQRFPYDVSNKYSEGKVKLNGREFRSSHIEQIFLNHDEKY